MNAILAAQAAASVRERQSRPPNRFAALKAQFPPPPVFPVDSFREAAEHLRRPFTDRAVKFKVQATWPKDDPKSGLIVAYIDARLVVERLNHVCPHLWSDDAYEALDGQRLRCHLTVDGITRADIGEGYQGKGLYSDALKRAAVKFGVGVSLYAIPKIILNAGPFLSQRSTSKGKTLVLTDAGEAECRKRYIAWLAEYGRHDFGDPLDHGDAPGSVGDPDAGIAPEAEAAEPARQRDPTAITKKRAEELVARAIDVGVGSERLSMWLTSVAHLEHEPFAGKGAAVEVVRRITPEQAEVLDTFISDAADGAS